ncbi:MAG: carboxypeptidase-like regulatory domain-containing protein, partial [Thermoanaerobaculia bacterium]
MAVRTRGFVPHYRWGVPLEPGKTVALGRLDLKPGASLLARVESEDGALPAGRTIARLLPLQAPGAGAAAAGQLQGTAAEAAVRADGFVQLVDLRPGTYLLEVSHPGFAPARVRLIEINAGQETRVAEPVVLRRPLRIELALRPAKDWLDRPWRVELRRFSEATGAPEPEPAFDAPVGLDGVAVVPGQTPGRYWVQVSDSRGNGMLFERFDVAGPEDARREIAIEVITVEGLLKLGDEPLAGTLAFGGEHGAVSITMESDEEGRFLGVLPHEGVWRVDVRSTSPLLSTHSKVEIRADRMGRAKAEISLPDTKLFGRVVTEAGRPAAGAEVDVSTALSAETVRADEKGEFVFRALPEGPSQVAARAWSKEEGRSTSDWALVALAEGSDIGPTDLRLRRVKPLAGRVESLRGPVAGAVVRLTPLRPLLGFGDRERTSLDGSFSAEVPGATEVVQAVVAAPGLSLKAFEVQAPEGQGQVVLFVTEQSGTLEIEVPFTGRQATERDVRLLVFQNGLPLSWQELRDWALSNGVRDSTEQRFSFPYLVPGTYRACMVPTSAITDWALAG